MKKFLITAVMLCTLFVSSKAYAQSFTAYTTDNGSTVEKTVFGFDEQPYLYLQYNAGPTYVNSSTISTWINPSGTGVFSVNYNDTAAGSFWMTPSDWTTYKKVGNWTINPITTTATLRNPFNGMYEQPFTSNVNFKVVPEPISAGLFVLGGAALAISRRKKS